MSPSLLSESSTNVGGGGGGGGGNSGGGLGTSLFSSSSGAGLLDPAYLKEQQRYADMTDSRPTSRRSGGAGHSKPTTPILPAFGAGVGGSGGLPVLLQKSSNQHASNRVQLSKSFN